MGTNEKSVIFSAWGNLFSGCCLEWKMFVEKFKRGGETSCFAQPARSGAYATLEACVFLLFV